MADLQAMSDVADVSDGGMSHEQWTATDLTEAIARWRDELCARGYPPATVDNYVSRSRIFVQWLAGEWRPRGPYR